MTNTSGSAGRVRAAVPVLASDDAPYVHRWRMLAVVLAAMFMAQFDLFVVNVSVPLLQKDLHAGQAALELIVGGYAFTYASGLVTGGRLGDIFSARKMFLFGMVAFTAASLLCGLAQSPGQLVAARLVQGLTAAAMVPQVLALITAVFPVHEKARALSWFGVTMGVGAVAGQMLGGALLEVNLWGLSWRIIFLVNVPIGLVAALLARRLLPTRVSAARPKLDPLGAIGVSGALALALVPLALGPSQHWPLWTWVSLIAATPVMVVALLWERALARRGGQPLLDLALFSDQTFTRGLAVNIGAFASFHSFMFTLTLVMQAGLGLSPLQAGFTFAPLGVAFALASAASQRITARQGARVITTGTTLAAIGFVLLLIDLRMSGGATSALRLVGPMIVIGTGNGLAVPALVGAVLAGVRKGQAGAAAGVLTTSQQFASAAGIAAFGSIFFQALGTGKSISAYASALQWVAIFDLVVVSGAALVSMLLPRPVKPAASAPVQPATPASVPAPADA